MFVGVRGTYQGLTATLLKQGSNQAIRFYVMNLLRNWYKGEDEITVLTVILWIYFHYGHSRKMIILAISSGDDPSRDMHPLVTAMFGATAGAASVFGNTPLDVVKTRMQVSRDRCLLFIK